MTSSPGGLSVLHGAADEVDKDQPTDASFITIPALNSLTAYRYRVKNMTVCLNLTGAQLSREAREANCRAGRIQARFSVLRARLGAKFGSLFRIFPFVS